MIAKCPTCEAKYKVADEKVSPGGTKFKCKKCKTAFTVYRETPQRSRQGPERRAPTMRNCPHCGKPVPVQAIKCRWCKEALTTTQAAPEGEGEEGYSPEGDHQDPFAPQQDAGGFGESDHQDPFAPQQESAGYSEANSFEGDEANGFGGPPAHGGGFGEPAYQQTGPAQYGQYAPSLEYAGFWLRVGAFMIDFILWIAVAFAFGVLMGIAGVNVQSPGAQRMMNLASTILYWLYFSLMESSSKQGTLGKMAVGIKVTDTSGEKVSFLRATGRHFGKYVSAIILMIGFVMAGFTAKKQALHDMMAGCLVVMRR